MPILEDNVSDSIRPKPNPTAVAALLATGFDPPLIPFDGWERLEVERVTLEQLHADPRYQALVRRRDAGLSREEFEAEYVRLYREVEQHTIS